MALSKNSSVVNLASCIAKQLHLNIELSSFEDITPHLFLEIYECLVGEPLLGARRPAILREDKEFNCGLILNKLESIVGISLDHIKPRLLVANDHVAISNLVEIFSGLMEHLMDSIVSDNESDVRNELLPPDPIRAYDQSISANTSDTTTLAEDIQSRYPNIYSVVGHDKVLRIVDAANYSTGTKSNCLDDELESLLNVDMDKSNHVTTSNVRYHSGQKDRVRKIATVSSGTFASASPKRFKNLIRNSRLEDSAPSGAVLDSSNYKATFAEVKCQLAKEKEDLARRLKTVKFKYTRAELAAKLDAEDAYDNLRNRIVDSDASARDSFDTNANIFSDHLLSSNKESNKNIPNAHKFSNVGFLSKTHAEEKKKMAIKRICAKYRRISTSAAPESPGAVSRRDLLSRLQVHFPGLELDDATSRRLWAEYSRHIQALGRVADSARAPTRHRTQAANISLAERQQQILLKIVKREMNQAKRLREENERRREALSARNRAEDAKIQKMRSQKYYAEFVDQARARMTNKQFGEEMLFRNLFREAIKAQRDRLLDLAASAREIAMKRDEAEAKHAAQLRASFQDRLRLLNEKINSERQVVEARENEQTRYLSKMKREIRSKLEMELRSAQSQMRHNFAAERLAFRELDADAIRNQIYAEAKQTRPFVK